MSGSMLRYKGTELEGGNLFPTPRSDKEEWVSGARESLGRGDHGVQQGILVAKALS